MRARLQKAPREGDLGQSADAAPQRDEAVSALHQAGQAGEQVWSVDLFAQPLIGGERVEQTARDADDVTAGLGCAAADRGHAARHSRRS